MKYRTIVADPPWRYRQTSVTRNGSGVLYTKKAIGSDIEYPSMSNAEIGALPVAEWADESAHLYLWVTNPRLYPEETDAGLGPQEIMRAWGFRYVTLLTWHKLRGAPGLGWYFRGETEHVLFGVRGRAAIDPAIRSSRGTSYQRCGLASLPWTPRTSAIVTTIRLLLGDAFSSLVMNAS